MDLIIKTDSKLHSKLSKKGMGISVAEFKPNCASWGKEGNGFQANIYFFEIKDKVADFIFRNDPWKRNYARGVHYIVNPVSAPLLHDTNRVLLLDDIPELNFSLWGRFKNCWRILRQATPS